MAFDPTPEQAAIVNAAKSTTDNLLVRALAGAAKTSTLVLIAQALPSTPILCLAFNKRIAVEMQERLPGNCESMTLNSLGHRVWAKAINKRLIVSTDKNYTILKTLIEEIKNKREKEAAYEAFSDLLKVIAIGKSSGYIPDGHFDQARGLMGDDDFFAELDDELNATEEDLVRRATIESIRRAMGGQIDFDDQILMPTVFPASFPQYPLVLIDEAQDLSALNHATLRKLARKRLIAVGDECQAIYAFRGARSDSMQTLEQSFSMRKLILSISFRCPRAVVREAQWRAPHMRWPEWAKEGEILTKTAWTIEDLPDTATIICRNNAPLFSMAIKLLKNGRYPQVIGNDIGKNLLKTLTKFGDKTMPKEGVMMAIEGWRNEKLKKSRSPGRVHDQAECMIVFAQQGDDLGAAIAYAEYIMSAKGPIQMMTGHKAKGLEFNDVFILDRDLIRVGEGQEDNLLYVMQTRSKNRLVYITSEGFMEEVPG